MHHEEDRTMRFLILLLFPPLVFFLADVTYGQTVSVISAEDTESLLVEAAVKRYLREEGYTVKGGTNDGFVLSLNVMPSQNVTKQKMGVAGNVIVAALEWQDIADKLVSQKCQDEHNLAQKVKEIVGMRMLYINGTIGTASTEDRLGEMFATLANREIRKASQKVTNFLNEMNKREQPIQTDLLYR
jgi:hypothetical protein